MIVQHAGTGWKQPLCGNDTPDSSGTVTTVANPASVDCSECLEAIGGAVCVCGEVFLPGELGASAVLCYLCATERMGKVS